MPDWIAANMSTMMTLMSSEKSVQDWILFSDSNVNLDDFVSNLKTEGVWGSELSIGAMCNILKVNFHLYKPLEDGRFQLFARCEPVAGAETTINLRYELGLHYDGLLIGTLKLSYNTICINFFVIID